jgi:hypothetical protein
MNLSSNEFGEDSYLKADVSKRRHVAREMMQYASFALLLFGVKLWVIGSYGNATPYWDQWDGEAANLYSPSFNHTLSWRSMFNCHNEHRIFTTRVLALFLLKINEIWNPLLQMVVNAGLHVLTLMVWVFFIKRVLGRGNYLPVLLGFLLFMCVIPFGWENTLAGFQSQFYFVILFGVISLWLLAINEPFKGRWWAGLGCGLLTSLSLASGVFVFAAAALISVLFLLTGTRRNVKQVIAIAVLTGLFIGGFLLTPVLPGHARLKASSLHQFTESVKTVLGWPVATNLLAVCIVNIPILIFTIGMLKKRPPATDKRWFLLAIAAWMVLQEMSITYGRALGNTSSRYRDLFNMLIFVNFACLLLITREYAPTRWRNLAITGLCGWVTVILVSLHLYGADILPMELAGKKALAIAEEKNTRDYVITHDVSYLRNKSVGEIPYPDPDALAARIELPGIREILPNNINAPLQPVSIGIQPKNAFVPGGCYFLTPKRIEPTWGSYTSLPSGDTSVGEMTLRFKASSGSHKILIPVAGYPSREGIKLELIQNGKSRILHPDEGPPETWGAVYTTIDEGEFSLRMVDSSRTTWLAVTGPVIRGTFDGVVSRMLPRYYLFLSLGLVILLFLFIQQALPKQELTV